MSESTKNLIAVFILLVGCGTMLYINIQHHGTENPAPECSELCESKEDGSASLTATTDDLNVDGTGITDVLCREFDGGVWTSCDTLTRPDYVELGYRIEPSQNRPYDSLDISTRFEISKELEEDILSIEGVSGIYGAGRYFCYVTKGALFKWDEIQPKVEAALEKHKP